MKLIFMSMLNPLRMGKKTRNSRKNMKPFDFTSKEKSTFVDKNDNAWNNVVSNEKNSLIEIQKTQEVESNKERDRIAKEKIDEEAKKEYQRQQSIERWNASMMELNKWVCSDDFQPQDFRAKQGKSGVQHEINIGNEIQRQMFLKYPDLMFQKEISDVVQKYKFSPMSIWESPSLLQYKKEAFNLYKTMGGYHYNQ